MSAANLIKSFGDSVTVRRYEPGAYVEAKWVDGAFAEFETIMSIQPLNGKDLLNLPEAQRAKNLMKGYASVELKTVDEAAGRRADQVLYQGQWFAVQRVETWRDGNNNLDHWKVTLAEVNP